MKIRPATSDDAENLSQIHIAGWQTAYGGIVDQHYLDSLNVEARADEWRGWMSEGTQPLLACDEDGAVTGFVALGKLRTAPPGMSPIRPLYTSEIYALYVDPDFWRQGIGTKLMNVAAKELQAQKHDSMCLWVLEKNKQAGAFYKKLGGERCGKIDIEIGPSRVKEVCYGWRKLTPLLDLGS